MRITSLFLLTVFMHAGATGFSQTRVSISGKDITLSQIFKTIEQQTGYVFVTYDNFIEGSRRVTVNLHDVYVEDAIKECLKDQPLGYSIVGKTIFLKKKTEGISISPVSAITYTDVHGKVINEKGEPLAGASIQVKGSKIGTQTDQVGMYTLKQVPTDALLYVSYTGYSSRQIKLDGKSFVEIILIISANPLDAIQVIAYGTTTQRLSTGNITSVSAKEIEEQPVGNPLLALEGRVPGLDIVQSTGLPGSGVTVRIQGQNSIANGNDPLYVIDGVPYSSQLLPSVWNVLGSSGGPLVNNSESYGSPLSFINPGDIESIVVLKDADATAIYGSRAANGAILITTKRAKNGATDFSFNIQDGWGKVGRILPLLNNEQYLEMRHEALNNDGITPSLSNGDNDLLLWDTARSTDWQKQLIGGASKYSDISSSVSGGNANTSYLLSGTYHYETTVFPGDPSDRKGSVHFSVNSASSNQKFHLQFSGNYFVDNNILPYTDLTGSAIQLAPDAPTLYNADGSLNWEPNASGSSTWTNPLASIYNKFSVKTNNLISDLTASYDLANGLQIKTNLGYTNLQANELVTQSLNSYAPQDRPYFERAATYGDNNINSWIFEPQATYKLKLGNGRLDALGGLTLEQNNQTSQQLVGMGYNSDEVMGNIASATSIQAKSSIVFVYKYSALFGRLNYNWGDEYIVDLNFRRDGSSRFGPQNQFSNFGSLGGAWVFTKEDVASGLSSFLDFGKLRGSYGWTGSDQIGDYQFLDLYQPLNLGNAYQTVSALTPTGLSNPYLQWEETRKLQLGLDLSSCKGRITFSGNYFNNHSSNQLLNYTLPIITGFNSVYKNFPAEIVNQGWELTLNTINIKSEGFSWSTSVNISFQKNKLASFPGLASSNYANILVIGQPINIQKVFHFIGVTPATGVYQFVSKTDPNNPIYPDDANVAINLSPTIFGGLQNSFTYKNFELDVFFQFVRQKGPNYYFGNYPGTPGNNQPEWILKRWMKPGDITSIQRFNSDYSLVSQDVDVSYYSDAGYGDASYIRLKNCSFSWQIPSTWQRKAHVKTLKLFIHGQNLFTITHYKGLDPESRNSTTLPPLRVIDFGIQMHF
jgi:TonB-linked SusC/RagA family outer membrane protein